jgi:hypothetical protein
VNPVASVSSDPAHEGAPPRVGYLIYRVERRLRVRLDEAVGAHGVTTTEYVTLSVLRERDGLSCAQLEACDHSVDGIEAAMLDGLTPETLGTVRFALSCARSVEATTPRSEAGPREL